jgi:hypothetical protein
MDRFAGAFGSFPLNFRQSFFVAKLRGGVAAHLHRFSIDEEQWEPVSGIMTIPETCCILGDMFCSWEEAFCVLLWAEEADRVKHYFGKTLPRFYVLGKKFSYPGFNLFADRTPAI